jgi:hypothetical protein
MKKHIFFLSIFINVSLNAQQWQWAKSIEYGPEAHGTSISSDQDGNVYVTGNTSYYTGGGGSYSYDILWKFDSEGNLLWLDTLEIGNVKSVCDHNGNVYVASNKIIKYNSIGQKIWTIPIPVYGTFTNLTLPITGGIVLVGQALVDGHTVSILYHYDENGNLLWNRTGDFPAGNSIHNSIACDNGGTVYWIGEQVIADTIAGFLAKVDASGNLFFTETIPSGAMDIAVASDNSLYIMGMFYNTPLYIDNISYHLPNAFYYIKYNPDGTIPWYKIITGSYINAIETDQSGNSYMAASIGDTNNLSLPTGGLTIIKLDSEGEITWSKTNQALNSSSGGHPRNIYISQNEDIFITGTIEGQNLFDEIATTSTSMYMDLFVGKVSVNFIGIEEDIKNNLLSVSPNPTPGIFRIRYLNDTKCQAFVNILNSAGKKIYALKVENSAALHNEEIDLSKDAKGIYYIEIVGDGKRSVQKIILN